MTKRGSIHKETALNLIAYINIMLTQQSKPN